MLRIVRALSRNCEGAVAPTVALSLIGLIAVGGLAFDYARLAGMDTELQSAADQAALSAATQLDGSTGSRARATAAAVSLLRNTTLFADANNAPSGDARRVGIQGARVKFYKTYNAATDTPGAEASDDADAKVVIVTVDTRRATYAFTPIVGALNSGSIAAEAVASLSSAICKIPPLMICAPSTDYPTPSDVGKGILLQSGGGGAWVPGNYGYLDAGGGANAVKAALGRNDDVGTCTSADGGIQTEPGNMASVPELLNTRLDYYEKSNTPACNAGDYCPAQNVRKDMSRTEEVKIEVAEGSAKPATPDCGDSRAEVAGNFAQDSNVQSFSRDSNQTSCTTNDNSCPKFGTGIWNRDAYVAAVHPSTTTAAIAAAVGKTAATLTRWDVYQWELANPSTRMPSTRISSTDSSSTKKGITTWTFTNKCAFPAPKNGAAVIPSSTQKDRRMLTVAVVDCTGQSGRFNAHVLRFADMFLTQPSLDRPGKATGKDQIYFEVVRVAQRPNGESAFQYYLRQRPRLIK